MSSSSPPVYPPASQHDPVNEIFPHVFLVRGSLQANPLVRFNRNMVVIRNGTELSVLNSVRLTPEGEADLDRLGKVRHVLRLGYFHGRDDRYYVDRYKADFWAQPGARKEPGPDASRLIEAGTQLPFPDSEVFAFQQTKHPEFAVLVKREGGILITCDAVQHYSDRRFCSPLAKLMLPMMGFPLRMLIGPLWKKAMTPENGSLHDDYRRLMALQFRHLVPGHGSVSSSDTRQEVQNAIDAALGTGK